MCPKLRKGSGVRAGGKGKRPRAESCMAKQHLQPLCHDFLSLSASVPSSEPSGSRVPWEFGQTSLALKDWSWMQGGIRVCSSSHVSLEWKCCCQRVPGTAGALAMQSRKRGLGMGVLSCHISRTPARVVLMPWQSTAHLGRGQEQSRTCTQGSFPAAQPRAEGQPR